MCLYARIFIISCTQITNAVHAFVNHIDLLTHAVRVNSYNTNILCLRVISF